MNTLLDRGRSPTAARTKLRGTIDRSPRLRMRCGRRPAAVLRSWTQCESYRTLPSAMNRKVGPWNSRVGSSNVRPLSPYPLPVRSSRGEGEDQLEVETSKPIQEVSNLNQDLTNFN